LRKRLTIVMTQEGDAQRHLVVTKGAFLNVLSICTQVERDGAVCPLTDAIISELSTYYEARGKAGLRVLALASRVVSAKGAYQRDDEREMVFAGFLPAKEKARGEILAELANVKATLPVGSVLRTGGVNPATYGVSIAGAIDLTGATPSTSFVGAVKP